jgi:hypothetical protein
MVLQLALGTALILVTVLLRGARLLGARGCSSAPAPGSRGRRTGRSSCSCSASLCCGASAPSSSASGSGLSRSALLDIFGTLEGAVYFSIVAYTTLGFGDILLPLDWRLLGGMASANGL